MIKATAQGPSGPVILLGLSHANLDRLADGDPICFDNGEVGLGPGSFFLGTAAMESAVRTLMGADDLWWGVESLAGLRAGEVLTLPGDALAPERGVDGTQLVCFSGADEAQMVEMLAHLVPSAPAPNADADIGEELDVHAIEEWTHNLALAGLLLVCVIVSVVAAILQGKPDFLFITVVLAIAGGMNVAWYRKKRGNRLVFGPHGVRLEGEATIAMRYEDVREVRALRVGDELAAVRLVSMHGQTLTIPKGVERFRRVAARLEKALGQRVPRR